MIRPPGFGGAAFGTAADGDGRHDLEARRRISPGAGDPRRLGVRAPGARQPGLAGGRPGPAGRRGRPLHHRAPPPPGHRHRRLLSGGPGRAGSGGAGSCRLAGGGGRGGARPAGGDGGGGSGPGAGGDRARDRAVLLRGGARGAGTAGEASARPTRRGTAGVDLAAAAAADLPGLEVWQSGICTSCGTGFHSYRRDGGRERQVAVAWLA